MTTDPTLQAVHDDGYATANDEINMLIAQLTAAWGSVVIECDGETCIVTNRTSYVSESEFRFHEAPTLLAALRLAAAAVEEEGKP